MLSRKEELRFRIKMADTAQRYEDMLNMATELSHESQYLDSEDQNLISLAYKNYVGTLRSSLKKIASIKADSIATDNGLSKMRINAIYKKYQKKIEDELQRLCNDMIEIIDSILSKKASSNEMTVFNGKLKGDYMRYKIEIMHGEARDFVAREARDVYQDAYRKGLQNLSSTNSVFLGTSLNFAVFLKEIQGATAEAIDLCKETIGNAMTHYRAAAQEPSPESAKIIQIMRDNITLWATSEK